jgi:hypothetical protein
MSGRTSAGPAAQVREQVLQHRFLLDPDTALGESVGQGRVPWSRGQRARQVGGIGTLLTAAR